MRMQITYEVLGGHVHMSIWTGSYNLGKAGDLCMTTEEFVAWKQATMQLEFVEKIHV